MEQASLVDSTDSEYELSINTPTRIWEFRFVAKEDLLNWKQNFQEVIDRLNVPVNRAKPPRRVSYIVNNPPPDMTSVSSSLTTGDKKKPSIIPGFAPNVRNSFKLATADNSVFSFKSAVEDVSELSIVCATWNLAEELPEIDDINFLKKYRYADILTFGVQEFQNLMHVNSSGQISPVDVWQAMLTAALGLSFELVGSKVMGGIHLVVFVKKDIRYLVSNIHTGFVPCGIGNVMYNKGACGVSFDFKDTSICFISAHLQANRKRVSYYYYYYYY